MARDAKEFGAEVINARLTNTINFHDENDVTDQPLSTKMARGLADVY